jgi:hypothetical protein
MEVFVVILLLFGAFSLGSATHEEMDALPTTMEVTAAVNESPHDEPRASEDDDDEAPLQDCMMNWHYVIYRDLTRAHEASVDAESGSGGDCDGVCADE